MATSAGKTIGLVLLILIILPLLFKGMPILLMPLHILAPVFTGVSQLGNFSRFGHFGVPEGLIVSGSLIWLLIWIAIIIWVYRDAERRGMNGVLWALLVFVGNLVGLLIYLIVRTNGVSQQVTATDSQPCPKCGKSVSQGYAFCPHCGMQIEAVCPSCKKSVNSEWRVCPHCGEKLVNTK